MITVVILEVFLELSIVQITILIYLLANTFIILYSYLLYIQITYYFINRLCSQEVRVRFPGQDKCCASDYPLRNLRDLRVFLPSL